jgi:hypothetical protein
LHAAVTKIEHCIWARNIFGIKTMAKLFKCSECGEMFDDPTKAKRHTNSTRGRCFARGAVLQPVTISVRTSDRIAGGREQRIAGPEIVGFVPRADDDQNHHQTFSNDDVHDFQCPNGLLEADIQVDAMEGSIRLTLFAASNLMNFQLMFFF